MSKRRWPIFTGVTLLLGGLGFGLWQLAGLTSSSAYPKMSSLNNGPDGAKLLHDALSSLPGVNVVRNFLPISQWHPQATNIVFLSVRADRLKHADNMFLAEFERLSQPDNKLLLFISDEDAFSEGKDSKKKLVLTLRWGLDIKNLKSEDDDEPELQLLHDASWQGVPGVTDAWEKRFGPKGSIIVLISAQEFCNKNLADDPETRGLIPSLMGDGNSVAFEETHLGIEESGSIAGLARRYRLEGLAGGLLLLALLFIWNQSVSFPPAPASETGNRTQIAGADARGMFAGLIGRHLTPQGLLESCVAEWNRVNPKRRITETTQSKVDPVAAYKKLQEGLRSKRSQL